MASNSPPTEVKVEHDIESFKAEISSRLQIVARDFDAFLELVEPKMTEIFRLMADYSDRQELRGAFPPAFLVGCRMHSPRGPQRENATATLVGTFWAPESLRESP